MGTRRNFLARSLLGCTAALLLAGCGIDAVILSQATNKGHVIVPDPKDSVVVVQTDPGLFATPGACAGGVSLEVLRADGTDEESATVATADAFFEVRLPGVGEHHGLVLQAVNGGQMAMGLVPAVPQQDSVLAPEKWYVFEGASPPETWSLDAPAMRPLGVRSTAITLALFRRAQDLDLTLAGLPRGTVVQAIADLNVLLDGSEYLSMVGLILQCGELMCAGPLPFSFPAKDAGTEGEGGRYPFLSEDFATAARATCPGLDQLSVAAFDTARAAIADQLTLQFSYDETQLRVVVQVDLNEGLSRNCTPTQPFNWATDEPGKKMFIAGGVHVDTPICNETRTTHCLPPDERSRINIAMGNDAERGWQPNAVQMYDDGTHGDVRPGDRIFTLTFDVPYWDPADAADGAGLRLHYKYTYGFAGGIWTGAEEWPGNSRLFEVVDLNGDHLAIRYDLFGDETSNKDKQNLLSPASGGCGFVLWHAQQDQYPNCVMDSRENQIDTDGDCSLDSWAVAPTVLPIVVEP